MVQKYSPYPPRIEVLFVRRKATPSRGPKSLFSAGIRFDGRPAWLAVRQVRPRFAQDASTVGGTPGRKRMLRLLIKDITVEKPANQKQLLVHIRWQGGACSDISVQLPLNIADRVRYPAAVVDKVRELACNWPDSEIADRLNREGQTSAKGRPYTE